MIALLQMPNPIKIAPVDPWKSAVGDFTQSIE